MITLTAAHRRQLVRARGERPQSEIAGKLGVSSQFVNMLERGKKTPTPERLVAWARAVGLRATISVALTSDL